MLTLGEMKGRILSLLQLQVRRGCQAGHAGGAPGTGHRQPELQQLMCDEGSGEVGFVGSLRID